MKKHLIKRSIALILAILCLCVMCVSCIEEDVFLDDDSSLNDKLGGGKDKNNNNKNELRGEETGIGWETDVVDTMRPDIDDSESHDPSLDLPTYDFGCKEIRTLTYDSVLLPEFGFGEIGDDILDRELYYRDIKVEERLNVHLVYEVHGSANDYNSFIAHVDNIYAVDLIGEYDIINSYSVVAPVLALRGYFLDMSKIAGFEGPYWNDDLTDLFTVNDKLYYTAPMTSPNLIGSLNAVFFDIPTLENNKISVDDLYRNVFDGTWTYEKMYSIAADLYTDTNCDGTVGNDDLIGVRLRSIAELDSFYLGADLKIVDKGSDGLLRISPDADSERMFDVFDLVQRMMFGNSIMGNPNEIKGNPNGNFGFYVSSIAAARPLYMNRGFDEVGVLPFPKYDDCMDGYRSPMGVTYCLYSVPTFASEPEIGCIVIQSLAEDAYTTVPTALMEYVTMDNISAPELKDKAQIFELILKGVTNDELSINSKTFSSTASMFRNALLKDESWASTFAQYKDALGSYIKKFNITMTSLDN